MIHVLDTNVLIIANGQHTGDDRCELASLELIESIRESGSRIGVDANGDILKEYYSNLDPKRPYGAGTQLLIELYRWTLRTDIEITPHPERGFEEFPISDSLSKFDPGDRKFVAVSLKAGQHTLSVATDSDFWHFRAPLTKAGVNLSMICAHRFTTEPSED